MPRAEITQQDPPEPPPADPGLHRLVVSCGLALFSTVVLTALYGTEQQSERAFRILPWMRRKPDAEDDDGRRPVRAKRR